MKTNFLLTIITLLLLLPLTSFADQEKKCSKHSWNTSTQILDLQKDGIGLKQFIHFAGIGTSPSRA